MNQETKEKLMAIRRECEGKNNHHGVENSSKLFCIGVAAALLVALGATGCGGKEKEPPRQDADEAVAQQIAAAQAEMQRLQAEAQAQIAAANAAGEAARTQQAAIAEARQQEAEQAQRAFQEQHMAQMQSVLAQVAQAQTEAFAERDRRLAERDQRLAEAEAKRKENAAASEARIKANQAQAQARKQAIADAKNHIPADTGELSASSLSDKDFSQVFIGDSPEDEGTIYAHGRSDNIRVYQATSSGLLVGYAQGTSQYAAQVENLMENLGVSFDRVVWIDTKTRLNEENRPLRSGFYVRKGMHSHVGIDGGEHMLAQYVEITDEKAVAMLKEELKRRAEEKRIAEEEALELADERGAYELDIPIKSLCGFKLGAPPSQVKGLLLHEDGTPVRVLSYRSDMFGNKATYRLAKPFRLFTHASVLFADKGLGKHLEQVALIGKPDLNKITKESYWAEVEATVQLIEKKFGIQFRIDHLDNLERSYDWDDRDRKESIHIYAASSELSLRFSAFSEINRLDSAAKEASKTNITFDSDEGADQL